MVPEKLSFHLGFNIFNTVDTACHSGVAAQYSETKVPPIDLSVQTCFNLFQELTNPSYTL